MRLNGVGQGREAVDDSVSVKVDTRSGDQLPACRVVPKQPLHIHIVSLLILLNTLLINTRFSTVFLYYQG